MLSPFLVKCLCDPTFVIMCKSPAGAPSLPPSPFPGIFTRDPVSTPAGMRTLTVSVFGTVPLPLHNEHGGRLRPLPSQSGHSCEKRNRPPALCTWPDPLHVGQTISGPPMSPAPLQREHCSERLTVIFVVNPWIASSKDNARGISISAPRLGCGRGGSLSLAPPPKRSEKISRKLVPPPELEVEPQSKPVKSNPGAARPVLGWAPRAAASARLSEY